MTRRRRQKSHRNSQGGLLILAVCILVAFFLLSSPFIVFFANLSTQIVVTADTEHIANETAGIIDDHRFWLDAPRPGYDEQKATEIAKSAATSMCEKAGMKLENVQVFTTADQDGTYRTFCTLNVDAKQRFPFLITVGSFDMNSYFSGKFTSTGKTEHKPVEAYSIIHMDAPTRVDESNKRPLGFNQRDVVVLPAYGMFYTAVAGETKNPTPYGKGLAPNLVPENFFSMNHYHLKKSDLEYAVQTGNDVCNNSWHPGRVIDGQLYTVANH